MKKIFYLSFIWLQINVVGQSAMSTLDQAKALVSEGKLMESLEVVDEGLARYAKDHDLLAYKARILLWTEDFGYAEKVVERILTLHPDDYEGLQLLLNKHHWSNDWERLEEAADRALALYPDDGFFQEKKLLALLELKKYKSATQFFKSIKTKSAAIKKLGAQAKMHHHRQIALSSSYSVFDQVLSPWVEGRLQYSTVTKNSWNASMTYARMFDDNGLSFNSEYYPTISKNLHGFFDVGYSPSSIFPTIQVGGELITKVKSFEFSGGARHLKFLRQDEPVKIFTVAAGGYLGKYYSNYKAYLSMIDQSDEITHTFLIRRFFKNRFHYFQINVTNGVVPLQISNLNEVTRLNASSLLFTYSQMLSSNYIVFGALGGQKEEYASGSKRNRITGNLGLSKIF